MKQLEPLEKSLNELFVKNGPELPKGGKQFIVQYVPYISLFVGVLSLLAAYQVWDWARAVDRIADSVNQFTQLYGVEPVSTSRWSVALWISLGILVVSAILYIAAYGPLKARKKAGWNLLFYALLLGLVSGVVGLFTDYNAFGGLIGSIIGFLIGGWLLFQVRASYTGDAKPAAKPKAAAKK